MTEHRKWSGEKGVDADRKMKAKVKRVRKSWPEQLRKYESYNKQSRLAILRFQCVQTSDRVPE